MSTLSWKTRQPDARELYSPQRLDPYLQWALTTDFAGYTGLAEFGARTPSSATASHWLSFIAEVSDAKMIDELIGDASKAPGKGEPMLHIPPVYQRAPTGSRTIQKIFTGRVRYDALDWLLHNDKVVALELGLPVLVPDMVAAAPPAASKPVPAPAAPGARMPSKVIGVIDYGGPFLHPRFLTASGRQTRFHRVWDQGVSAAGSSAPWRCPASMGYGRELDRQAIRKLLPKAAPRAASESNMAVYARLGYVLERDSPDLPRVIRDTHGAHVVDVAAGLVDPLAALRRTPSKDKDKDPASQADLVFVQIPLPTLVDSSGGSLNVHVLDGIRYIVDCASAKADVVINISYGQHAGPHDGTSLLERAIDDLVAASGRRIVVVIGAGNGRDAQSHADLQVTNAAAEVLCWDVPPRDNTESFLELWYPASEDGQNADLSIEVRPPGGNWSPPVKADAAGLVLLDDSAAQRQPIAQLIHAQNVANGKDAMVLLALAPTASSGPARPGGKPRRQTVPPGLWEIRLRTGRESAPVHVHAWIERDDMPESLARSAFRTHVSEACTVNGIATGRSCIVVGGYRHSDGKALPYSGLGPTRDGRALPTVLAVCQESDALLGIRAGTMNPGDTLRMAGTSVAAPAATRVIFNQIVGQRQPPAAGSKARVVVGAKPTPPLDQALQHIRTAEHRKL